MNATQRVIVVEGFRDRAFLRGWFESGAVEDSAPSWSKATTDPWGNSVGKGQNG
jgi:5S rRNA maturation endonuclease (ribonuclease M5)